MKILENERQALLRLAEFESNRLYDKRDTDLVMLQMMWGMFAKRDPARFKRIMAEACSMFDPDFHSPDEN